MSPRVLRDPRLYEFLFRIDQKLAEEVHENGCPRCGGTLHSAKYPRRPRGLPPGHTEGGRCFRFSFCCEREGCRSRATPRSVRFLGRKVFLGTIVVLVSAMRQGPSPYGAGTLHRLFGVTRRTLVRWQKVWTETFPETRFWVIEKARFLPVLREFPVDLADRFGADRSLDGLGSLLRFLSPLSLSARPWGSTVCDGLPRARRRCPRPSSLHVPRAVDGCING